MPERGFASETWNSDEWFQDLSRDQRYLFIYLWTNDHCNQAGLYHITLKTISDETLFPKDELPEFLNSLAPKVVWYPEENLIWVKNFIKRQSKSPKFIAAAAKCLTTIHHNGAIKELLDYNLKRYSISIPYQYYIDKLSILTRAAASASSAVAGSDTEGIGVVKGKGELSAEEREIISSLSQLGGWQADEDDVLWHQGLRSEFPGFTLAEFKACVDYYSGRAPPKHKGIWKNRFRNWMIKKQEFERRDKGGQPKQERVRPIKYIRGSEPAGPEDTEDMP
jgi:hypothetical protein